MPSLVRGFEYDIFISYRQNDNRSGWVTDFVKHLNEELAATIKEPVSVYFDSDPYDGLLETHSVDKSLEEKLRCLIFIPILSQTYCDTKSYAWRHEFCAFNKQSASDQFGRDIRLRSGNVSSRILPIQIHELDEGDRGAIEAELGCSLRSLEFIYQSAGVVRPLLSTEVDPKGNLTHTYYRDQVNKAVRSIKEIVYAIQAPAGSGQAKKQSGTLVPPASRQKLFWTGATLIALLLIAYAIYYLDGFRINRDIVTEKSIAVIPFTNMNKDPEQDYLSDGIAEDILNHLVKIEDLKVKSRTSTLQYKNTTKTIQQIGEELEVGAILEGSVRRAGDRIRIVVQLIDVNTDDHLWSETYDREMKDVLTMQGEIALEIANVLKAHLSDKEKNNISNVASINSAGYDQFLRARSRTYSPSATRIDYLAAMAMVEKAIRLDPNLAQAYALKGQLHYILGSMGAPLHIWRDSSLYYASRAIAVDGEQPEGYVVRGNVLRALARYKEASLDFEKAFELAPNNSDVLNAVGNELLRAGNKKGAEMILQSIEQNNSRRDPSYFISWFNVFTAMGDSEIAGYYIEKLREIDPVSVNLYWNSAWTNRRLGNNEQALKEAQMGFKMNPDNYSMIDILGWSYYSAGMFEQAEATFSLGRDFEKKLEDTTQHVPFRHRLAMVKLKLGKTKEAEELFREEQQLDMEQIKGHRGFGIWGDKGSAFYDMAGSTAALGHTDLAIQYLDSAFAHGFGWYDGYSVDPLFESLQGVPAYKKLVTRVKADQKFRQEAFREALSNLEASRSLRLQLDK